MKNKFTGTSLTITDANIYGGVNYQLSVNSDTDLQVGGVPSAEITFTTDALTTNNVGKVLAYQVQQNNDSAFRNVGVFNVSEVTKNTSGKFDVIAYDNISKFDKIVDTFLDTQTYPVSAGSFFSNLCAACNCTAASTTFTNSNFSVTKKWTGSNITGRTVLSWIASLAGSFAYATASGTIGIRSYTTSSTTIDNSKYKKLTFADYTVPAIDKVTVRQTSDDAGYSYGSGSNVLIIEGNPLLSFTASSEISTAVQNIYSVVNGIGSYVPSTVELYEDYSIDAGQKVTINSFNTLTFNKQWCSSGVTFESSGNPSRDNVTTPLSSSVMNLQGKTHELISDVDSLTSRITVAEGTLTSHGTLIQQNANNITIEANTRSGADTNLQGQITVNANKVAVVVDANNDIKAAEIVASINDESSSVKISADHITLDGNVVMKSNLTDGTTTISGNNLKTGTIDASTVSVTNLNASNIKAGSLDADYVDIKGDIEVYAGSTSVGFIGGSSNSVGMKSTSSNNSVTCSTSGITLGGTQLLLTNATMYGPSLPSPDDYSVGAVFFVTGS